MNNRRTNRMDRNQNNGTVETLKNVKYFRDILGKSIYGLETVRSPGSLDKSSMFKVKVHCVHFTSSLYKFNQSFKVKSLELIESWEWDNFGIGSETTLELGVGLLWSWEWDNF